MPLQHFKLASKFNISENFYNEMLQSWADLNFHEPKTVKRVILQPLWHNDLITVGKEIVNYTTWKKAGINIVAHLLDNNGITMTKKKLQDKYGVSIKQMEYNSLIHSIPKFWTKLTKNQPDILELENKQSCSILLDHKYIKIEEITTRDIYIHLIDKNKNTPPTSKKRWIDLYDDMNLDDELWQMIYETPFKITKNVKILMVQYKLIHRILAVNHNLKKWKRIDDDQCEVCGKCDTLEHFIYECPDTLALWVSINNWWKNQFEFKIPITILEIIFGIPNENGDNDINLLNTMILVAKYYIYIAKKKKESINLYDYLLMLKNELKLKKVHYTENRRLQTFDKYWKDLYDKI
jgi:hypothetical protein